MKSIVLVIGAALLSACSAYPRPSFPLYPPVYAAAPVAPVFKSQYHAQDELGQYTYGYTDGVSAKAETKTFDGVTRGGYSYLDSNGVVQNVNYVSDPANGFRVAATNLPLAPVPAPAPLPVAPVPVEDTPEVAAAKVAHLTAAAEAESAPSTDEPAPAEPETTEAPAEPSPAPSAPAPAEPKVEVPAAQHPGTVVPVVPAPAPLVTVPVPAPAPLLPAPAPVVRVLPAPIPVPSAYVAPVPAPIIPGPITSQYHSQDELGQYSYGYAGGPSAKSEIKTFDGITRGGYSYLDANGIIQSAAYVSDPVNGFRVAASNIPLPAVPVVIPDSPEVAEAKAKHLAISAEAAAAAAASPTAE